MSCITLILFVRGALSAARYPPLSSFASPFSVKGLLRKDIKDANKFSATLRKRISLLTERLLPVKYDDAIHQLAADLESARIPVSWKDIESSMMDLIEIRDSSRNRKSIFFNKEGVLGKLKSLLLNDDDLDICYAILNDRFLKKGNIMEIFQLKMGEILHQNHIKDLEQKLKELSAHTSESSSIFGICLTVIIAFFGWLVLRRKVYKISAD
jgi:hypothetical protein